MFHAVQFVREGRDGVFSLLQVVAFTRGAVFELLKLTLRGGQLSLEVGQITLCVVNVGPVDPHELVNLLFCCVREKVSDVFTLHNSVLSSATLFYGVASHAVAL